jgi:hypothetical protein
MLQTSEARASSADLLDLQRIPGVGPRIARDLADLGIRRTADLRRRSPERMYRDLCRLRSRHQDRCVLYVFRCAVYFASTPRHDGQLLRWWNWSDGRLAARAPSSVADASKRGHPRDRRFP